MLPSDGGDDLAAAMTWRRRWQRRGGRGPCGGDGDLAAATATARGERSWQWRQRRRGAGRLRGGAGGSGDDLAAGTTWRRRWQRRGGRVPCGGDGDLPAATATARGERSWRQRRQRRGGRGPGGGDGNGEGGEVLTAAAAAAWGGATLGRSRRWRGRRRWRLGKFWQPGG
uniref:p0047B08.12 protein n=1 Tax=Oryza sativa subsp. japonica TaxID=39947 RepID=Q94JA0_ORYSJ|nr:P0047B08.12 [Oryza sativa Japonica Group]